MPRALFAVLVLTGLALAGIGLNTALGGMRTLGWQFPTDVFSITDPLGFARHDNNARFFGGVFTAMGLFMASSPLWFAQAKGGLLALLAAITLGGVMRLLDGGYALFDDGVLVPSLIAELALGPLLMLWISKTAPSLR